MGNYKNFKITKMKAIKNKIILIVLLIIFSKIVTAQYIIPGSYNINNTLTRFEGTWRWTSGTDTVWLNMQKQKVHFSRIPCDRDLIVGWHKYKKGNTIIESNFQFIGVQYAPSTHLNISIFGGNDPTDNISLFDGTIKDISKNKTIDLTLTINAVQNQIVWKSKDTDGTHISSPSKPFIEGFTLPNLMTFIKQ